MKKYDYLIVGAGLYGAVFAYEASKKGKKCLVIDRRNHIGGNIYCENINDIKEGDYVVHRIHGVGKYLGLNQMEIDGEYKDYLTIEYANNDKLHIVAEQINMLSRYRGVQGGSVVKLSKMEPILPSK